MSPFAVRRDVAAQHHTHGAVRRLTGRAEPPAGVTATPVSRLPLLIDEPRWVRFADRCFAVRSEGLYRFWAVAGDFCGYEQFVPGFGDDAELDAWYRGMFAAPYHIDGSTPVFRAATKRARRLLERNEPGAEVLAPEAWAERFYGKEA
ncbi:MAG: hypothetical protein OXC31_15185 [Spirochaetaceae bacterium]|nr:hypothetical protein [Spirochaetaceae bacterium]